MECWLVKCKLRLKYLGELPKPTELFEYWCFSEKIKPNVVNYSNGEQPLTNNQLVQKICVLVDECKYRKYYAFTNIEDYNTIKSWGY